jgi:thiamine pyrophosphate-dependent acetolactate synthase large subunit-like protein
LDDDRVIDRVIAIQAILRRVAASDLVLSTTGMISREVFVTDDRPANFYMLGSMGLLSSFGLGLALQYPDKRIYVLEGDGSALMSLGALPLIATERPDNLIHIILDNEAYESTGSQPSISSKVDLAEIGKSCGYGHVVRVDDIESLEGALLDIDTTLGPTNLGPRLMLVKVGIAPVKDIPRITHAPTEIRDRFKSTVQSGK